MLETVFLDAGGVLVFPNWTRISRALDSRGVQVAPESLARAEHFAKKKLDVGTTIRATNDAGRGWLYFNLIFEETGVPVTDDQPHPVSPGSLCCAGAPASRHQPRNRQHQTGAAGHS